MPFAARALLRRDTKSERTLPLSRRLETLHRRRSRSGRIVSLAHPHGFDRQARITFPDATYEVASYDVMGEKYGDMKLDCTPPLRQENRETGTLARDCASR